MLRNQIENMEELLTKQNINLNIENGLLKAEREIYRREFKLLRIRKGIDLSSILQNLEEIIESEHEKSKFPYEKPN